MLISVIVPVFNEEDGIARLAERLSAVLGSTGYEYEIVVVDDGSVDSTLGLLENWQEIDKRLVIVKLSRNWGHQSAFNAGLDVAKGDAIIFMDGDLEDPPELIPELIKSWEEGFDTVYTVKRTREQENVRRVLTNIYYCLIKRFLTLSIEPQAGMFSLVDKKVADVLRLMKESNKSYPNLRTFSGFRQKGINYDREPRYAGRPKQTIKRLLADGLNALFSNTYIPIRIFTLVGVFFSLLFIVVGFIVITVRVTGIEFWIFRSIPGTQLILLSVLTFGALQMTFLGVLGEYIARIYEESKGRPYYVIENVQRSSEAEMRR